MEAHSARNPQLVILINLPLIPSTYKSTEQVTAWRRACGCLRTSEKLKQILKVFPEPPPPTPSNALTHNGNNPIITPCEYQPETRRLQYQIPAVFMNDLAQLQQFKYDKDVEKEKIVQQPSSKSWQLAAELVSLLQLSITATALALYYLLYCYMQLIYFTLRSVVYFHQADGAMKITIAIVTVTSIIVGFQILIRIEKLVGITT